MKAIIIQRYNGWELSKESNGPLVKFEDVREIVERHDELVRKLNRAVETLVAIAGEPSRGCSFSQDVATSVLREISE